MAELTANSHGPKQRSVYLITYSQYDSSHLSRTQFTDIIVDAWHSNSRSKILQWVVSLESHQNRGSHFHMAIKLSTTSRWRAIRRFVDNKHGIKLNFSDSHTNYYTAYEYVTKEDPNFMLSPGHPDLANTSTPNTTNATHRRQSEAAGSLRRCAHHTNKENTDAPATYGLSRSMAGRGKN